MKLKRIIVAVMFAAVAVAVAASAQAAGVNDSDMGLSKTSVYDAPTPEATMYVGGNPGANKAYDKSYHTAPPMIPHKVDMFLPVTMKNNMCVGCHDKPALIGIAMQGMPTPAPKSHYMNPADGMENMKKVDGSRFVCTQCHAPQADAAPLVSNTFVPDK